MLHVSNQCFCLFKKHEIILSFPTQLVFIFYLSNQTNLRDTNLVNDILIMLIIIISRW